MSIAVVIPLYNHERYIAEALRSVLAQTRQVQRIVIVDDGSTDGSVELVRREFASDARIQLFTQQNSGAHVALNRGIAEAARNSEFIGILNSDDAYEPARIEQCVGFLEKNPAREVVCTRLRMIDQNSNPLSADDPKARWIMRLWQARPKNDEHLAEWLGIANFAKTSSNFVARSRYLLAHPFGAYRFMHDYFFAVIAAVEGKLGVLGEELLLYRAHPSNTIKSSPAENVTREFLQVNLDLLRELAPQLAASPQVRADYASYFRALCRNYADFRAEVFLHLIAQLVRERSHESLTETLRALDAERFPELNAPKSDALKEQLARAEYEALLRAIAASRWLALGRVFGVTLDVLRDAPTAEKRLSGLKKRCADSRWLRLGQRLGFVYPNI